MVADIIEKYHMVMNVPNIEELLSKNIIYIYNEIFRNNSFYRQYVDY